MMKSICFEGKMMNGTFKRIPKKRTKGGNNGIEKSQVYYSGEIKVLKIDLAFVDRCRREGD